MKTFYLQKLYFQIDQKFSSCVLSAVTVHDLCPDLLSSQQRQPSMQSCPGWWRQWWGWPLAYGPAWGRGRTDIISKTADRLKHIINDLLFCNCNAVMGVISRRIHHNPLHLSHWGDVVKGLITLNIYPWLQIQLQYLSWGQDWRLNSSTTSFWIIRRGTLGAF